MCDGPSGNQPNYTSYPEHMILEIKLIEDQRPSLKLQDHIEDDIRLKKIKLLNLVTNETTELTASLIIVLIGSKPDLFFLQTNFNINDINIKKECTCMEKKIEDNQKTCFLKNHWDYIKSVVEQSLQSCKSRYLNYSEINGNTDVECAEPDCNKRKDSCKCKNIPYTLTMCQCQTNPYSEGLGFGVNCNKPIDGRSNPIAIDKSTHEVLNAPKGMYALGPLTADNFVRFIPGGAVAIVSHIHKELKAITE